MGLFAWLFGNTSQPASASPASQPLHSVNPANGLPMANDAVDVVGNPFGTGGWSSSDAGSHCGTGPFDGYSPTFDTQFLLRPRVAFRLRNPLGALGVRPTAIRYTSCRHVPTFRTQRMSKEAEVVLVVLGAPDTGQRIGRVIATISGRDGEDRWSAEAALYHRARTGEIALGRTVVRASVPEDVHRALEAAISGAWHQGGDVRIVGADGRQTQSRRCHQGISRSGS